jgi:hypothetical protein
VTATGGLLIFAGSKTASTSRGATAMVELAITITRAAMTTVAGLITTEAGGETAGATQASRRQATARSGVVTVGSRIHPTSDRITQHFSPERPMPAARQATRATNRPPVAT